MWRKHRVDGEFTSSRVSIGATPPLPRPAALPFLLCRVMAASKTQGAVVRMEEDRDGSCSTVGGVGYGGEYGAPEARLICLPFSMTGSATDLWSDPRSPLALGRLGSTGPHGWWPSGMGWSRGRLLGWGCPGRAEKMPWNGLPLRRGSSLSVCLLIWSSQLCASC